VFFVVVVVVDVGIGVGDIVVVFLVVEVFFNVQ
jgi:hypothetical protein